MDRKCTQSDKHSGAESVKNDVVFEDEHGSGVRLDSPAQTFQVRLIYPPLSVNWIFLHDDKFDPVSQTDAAELPFSLLSAIFAFVQRDTVGFVEKPPKSGGR